MDDDIYVSTGSSTGIATVNVSMQPFFLIWYLLFVNVNAEKENAAFHKPFSLLPLLLD